MGEIRFNLDILKESFSDGNLGFKGLLDTVIHELAHTLIMSGSLFFYFHNPVTDRPYFSYANVLTNTK